MCLFMHNFSSTEFNSFPSAQQRLCGLEQGHSPLPSFINWKGSQSEGEVLLTEAGEELLAGMKRDQWPGIHRGHERKLRTRLCRGQGGQVLQWLRGLFSVGM